jgi:hypothetical protein
MGADPKTAAQKCVGKIKRKRQDDQAQQTDMTSE